MSEDKIEFPLSKEKHIKGSRRLAREKLLQIMVAFEISGTPIDTLFSHIFYRDFNFGDTNNTDENRLLKTSEVYEIDADVPIIWKDDEIEFSKVLLREVLNNLDFCEELLKKHADNWELGRIAQIDRILIYIAITEFISFAEIPPKVSINEAIDISKKYSTEKSGIFINGMLDSILIQLRKDDKIIKTGRGLNNYGKKK